MSTEAHGENDASFKKPDGSAYREHMHALGERNDSARKAGQAARAQRETDEVRARVATERDQRAKLRKRDEKSKGVLRAVRGS